MNADRGTTRFERLKAVRWQSARAWSPTARDLLFDFYERLLPVWPEAHPKLSPHSDVVLAAFSSRLSDAERARVDVMLRAVLDTAEAAGVALTSVNRHLVKLILVCEVLFEGGTGRATGSDPSEPLLELFEAGYDLNPTHGAVDICYQAGCTTVPLPTHEAVVQRSAARAAGLRR
jgi:hypothetical protein